MNKYINKSNGQLSPWTYMYYKNLKYLKIVSGEHPMVHEPIQTKMIQSHWNEHNRLQYFKHEHYVLKNLYAVVLTSRSNSGDSLEDNVSAAILSIL